MVDQCFWSDPDIEAAKAGVKLTALWLITNSQTSLLGLCGASASRFKFETGLKDEALGATIDALPRAFVRFGSVIFVRNYIRHQFGTGEKLIRNNFFVALKSLFLSVKDEALKAAILAEYPELLEPVPTRASKPFEGLTKPKDVQGSKVEEGKTPPKPREPRQANRPTLDEAIAYGKEIGMPELDVRSWFDHFESNGWKVGGKTLMKDWHAALRQGNRRKGEFHEKSTRPGQNGNSSRNVGHNAAVDYSQRPKTPRVGPE